MAHSILLQPALEHDGSLVPQPGEAVRFSAPDVGYTSRDWSGGPKGTITVTSQRLVWVAGDPHLRCSDRGACAVPLHCIGAARDEGGGLGLGLFSTFKLTVTVVPLCAGTDHPTELTFTFPSGGRSRRDDTLRVVRSAKHELELAEAQQQQQQPPPTVVHPRLLAANPAALAAPPPKVQEVVVPAPPEVPANGIYAELAPSFALAFTVHGDGIEAQQV